MTLISSMIYAVDVVTDVQSPLGGAVWIARIFSYLSTVTALVLVVRRLRGASSENQISTPAIRSTIGFFAISVLAVLILKASYDAGRSWSQLFDSAVLSEAMTSPVGVGAAVQLCVALMWMLLARSPLKSVKWRVGAAVSVAVLMGTFVADAAGLTSRSNDYQKFSISLVEANVVGDFTVAPTRVGSSEVHLYFSPPGGLLSPMKNVSLEFVDVQTNSAREVSLVGSGPNHWLGIADFDASGQYTMKVRALTAQDAAVQFTANIVIQP